MKDSYANIWIGTFGKGINKIIPAEKMKKTIGNYIIKKYPEVLKVSDYSGMITSLLPDKFEKKKLWIGTYGRGLFSIQFDNNSDKLAFIIPQQNLNRILSTGKIIRIVQDIDSSIWAGTLGNGLFNYHKNNNSIQNFSYNSANKNSLNDDDVISLARDKTGLLWIGTSFGFGVNKLNPAKVKLNHYTKESSLNSLSDNIIHCFAEDDDKNIWIGTYKGGLNYFDRKEKLFKTFKHNSKDTNSLISNHITSMCVNGKNLWIGTYDSGLDYFDGESKKFIHFQNDRNNANSLSDNRITCCVKDKADNIYVGTYNGGINKISKNKIGEYSFVRFTNDTLFSGNISDNRITTMYIDKDGYLWAALFNDELFRLKMGGDEFQKIEVFKGQKKDKHRIITICDDEFGNLWIGTNGAGLFRLDKNTGKSFHQEMLGEIVIEGILEDNTNNIWLSTNKGIIENNYVETRFKLFDTELKSIQFNSNASLKTTDGEFFFGSVDGFYSFYPERIKTSRFVTGTNITSIKTPEGTFSSEYPIELSYGKNNITFGFANMDFTNPVFNYYQYKLVGYDDSWHIAQDGKHTATYLNLSPGEFVFKVKGANSLGTWSSEEASVVILIHNPFWRTWWFIILIILIPFLVIPFVVIIKFKQHREIENLKMKLSADLHDSVGSGLTEIALLSEVVLASEKIPDKLKDKIDLIIRRSHELIENMSDIVWMVNPAPNSLYDLILRLKDIYSPLFESRGIQFKIGNLKELNIIKLNLEQRQNIYLIFKEAINNSIKYSCAKSVLLEANYSDRILEITFKDDGKGFNISDISSGNGLRNMKQRAKLIKSELEIASSEQRGTTIILTSRI